MNRFLTLASMLTFIDKNTPLDLIENLTVVQKVLSDDEHVLSSDIAGEGNMNVVLRIKTDRQSFILKQSNLSNPSSHSFINLFNSSISNLENARLFLFLSCNFVLL